MAFNIKEEAIELLLKAHNTRDGYISLKYDQFGSQYVRIGDWHSSALIGRWKKQFEAIVTYLLNEGYIEPSGSSYELTLKGWDTGDELKGGE